jgi:cytidylate kinase
MKKWLKITIDGPSASGKSTLAKRLAKKLGFTHLDSGAIYRSIALFFKEKNLLDKSDEEQKMALLDFSYYFKGRAEHKVHFLCDEDVTSKIRERDISELSSKLSVKDFIRDFATDLQRTLSEGDNIVIEGRDTGSVVFPHADVKFYLDADPIVRARRRFLDLKSKQGYKGLSVKDIENDIKERDQRDKARKLSPLICPEGATRIDTTNLSINCMVHLLSKKIKTLPYHHAEHQRYIFRYKGKKCSIVYFLTKWIFTLYFKIFHRLKVYGREHYKINSPAIIACNHLSFLDPPMIGVSCHEVIHSLGKKALFANPLINWWLKKIYSYPISGTSSDKEIMKKVVSLLLKGEKVLIFPEGTRGSDGKVQPLRKGLALLADKGNAKVIPAAVIGPKEVLPKERKFPKLFTPLALAFGPPIYFSTILKEVEDRKLAREVFLVEIQKAIQLLIDTHKH